MNTYARGSCLCGKVQFKIDLPTKWVAHCHCSMCRKFHGAGYVTWVGSESGKFNIKSGKEFIKWYKSSNDAERGSCSACGSNFLFRSKQWPDEIHITLANFDDNVDKAPQANAYFNNHVSWMPIDEGIKKIWK